MNMLAFCSEDQVKQERVSQAKRSRGPWKEGEGENSKACTQTTPTCPMDPEPGMHATLKAVTKRQVSSRGPDNISSLSVTKLVES